MVLRTKKAYQKFNGGLISENVEMRSDIAKYHSGCDVLTNCYPLVSGAAVFRAGTKLAQKLSSNFVSGSTINARLEIFAFDTEDVDVAAGSGDVYWILFIYNHNTSLANILILNHDGTTHGSPITTDANGDNLPWGSGDIADIRTEQIGDVVYVTSGDSNALVKIERTGSPGSFVFTVKLMTVSQDPFFAGRSVSYEFFDLSSPNDFLNKFGSGIHPQDIDQIKQFRDESLYTRISRGTHDDFVNNDLFFAYTDAGNHNQDSYDYMSQLDNFGLYLSGNLKVETKGGYRFAVNSFEDCGVVVNGVEAAGKYDGTVDEGIGKDEFDANGNNIELEADFHKVEVYHTIQNGGGSDYGAVIGWRKEETADRADGLVFKNGASASNVNASSLIRENYRQPYRVRIRRIGASIWQFKYQKITDVLSDTADSFSSWTTETGAGISIHSINTEEMEYPDGGGGTTQIAAGTIVAQLLLVNSDNIDILSTSTDDYNFQFTMGFERIPLVNFQQLKDTENTGTQNPFVLEGHKGRLAYGGNTNFPFRIWLSVPAEYENLTTGANDDDAVVADMLGGLYDSIKWMKSFDRLVVGTAGAIHIMPDNRELITPENKNSKVIAHQSNEFINPVISRNTLFGVNASGTDLYAMQIVDAETTVIQSETKIVEGMFSSDRIARIEVVEGTLFNHNNEDLTAIFVLTNSGKLKVFTFDLTEEHRAWCELRIGGDTDSDTINAKVIDMAAIPLDEGVRLGLLVNRDDHGLSFEYIDPSYYADFGEKIWDNNNDVPTADAAKFETKNGQLYANLENLDNYTGVTAKGGLYHVWYTRGGVVYPLTNNPKTIAMVDSDSDAVTEPTIALDDPTFSETAGDEVFMGLAYDGILTPLPPEFEVGGGSTHGMTRTWGDTYLKLVRTTGRTVVSHSEDSDIESIVHAEEIVASDYKNSNINNPTNFQVFINGTDDRGQITVKHTSPTPMNVLGISGDIEYDD